MGHASKCFAVESALRDCLAWSALAAQFRVDIYRNVPSRVDGIFVCTEVGIPFVSREVESLVEASRSLAQAFHIR